MPETIDSLTLDIGITSEEFQAGVDKILGSMNEMGSTATEVGDSMGASFASLGESVAGLALRFAGMFLAFKSVEGLVDYFKDLSVELANVGFAGKYLGQSAVELRRFGEVAELSGGKMQDAVTAAQGLESAIFGLRFEGQMSQNLLWLRRLGVAYLDANGNQRPIEEIARDVSSVLQRQLPGVGPTNTAMRVQAATRIFGAGGIANAVGGPLEDFQKNYARASKDNKDVTQALIDSQIKLQQATTSLHYEMQDVVAKALGDLTPTILDLINTIENELIPTFDEMVGDIMDLTHPGRLLPKLWDGVKGVMGDAKFANPITHPLEYLAWDLGLGMKGIEAVRELWGKNFATYKVESMPVPPQVMTRLAADTNLDALKLIHVAEGGDTADPTWSKTILAYRSLAATPGAPEALVNSAFLHGPPPPVPNAGRLSTPSAPRPASAHPGAPVSKPTSSTIGPRVSFGDITINTAATDADGIAADINRAVQRRLLVARSDPGLA